MCLKSNVLVVDKKESRSEGNAISFHDVNIDVFIYDGQYTKIYNGNNFQYRYLPDEIDLLILHNNNVGVWEKLDRLPKIVIKYTGGNPPQYEFPNDYWIRQRSIKTKDDAITKDEANQIINWIKNDCSENYLPDLLKPPKTTDCLLAFFIFCLGYLTAGVALEKIKDKEVEKLIGWNDKLKSNFPKITSSWDTVTNPQWWNDLGKVEDLKEQVRREMDRNLDENFEKLIDYIKGTNAIEDFETVKAVFKKLKGKK